MADHAHPESIVSTDWLAEHGSDANVRLVEVDVDTSSYDQGHIAGAVGWNWHFQLQQTFSRDLVSKLGMEQLLGSAGIDNSTTVILYGDNNWFAAWAFWQMKYYGHPEVMLMNGGRAKWDGEGKPLTTDAVSHAAKSYTAKAANEDIRAYRDQVLSEVNAGSISLVDVRAPAEYAGERSSHTLFVLAQLLGHSNVRNYDGCQDRMEQHRGRSHREVDSSKASIDRYSEELEGPHHCGPFFAP